MLWLPDGEKVLICLFVLTEGTNVTDTVTRTPYASIGRACIASRGNDGAIILYAEENMTIC